jgi:isocitrate lyase
MMLLLFQKELSAEKWSYTATKHQREVGTGYFDLVSSMILSDPSEGAT